MKKFLQFLTLVLLFCSGNGYANKQADKFAENVLLHVVLHDLGHALIREFDLPVLGNEETMGDAFATHYVIQHLPAHALSVLTARVNSLLLQSREVPRNEWPVAGEHNNDARRAYQIVALAMAADHEKYASLAGLVSMSKSDVGRARDYGTEIHRSWRRVLQPLMMPKGMASNEARVGYDRNSASLAQLSEGTLLNDLNNVIRSFDWHSQITISFVEGNGGSSWRRNGRTITVNSEYIQRFIEQAKKLQ